MLWATLISVLTFVVGFALGFVYFAFRIAKDSRPMTIEFVKRMVALHENEGRPSVLVGRRQMISFIKHHVEAHGLVHKADVLAWLQEMDEQFIKEQKQIGERMGLEARRQIDAEDAEREQQRNASKGEGE